MAKAIGKRMQTRRLQLGWSRKTLAGRAGVNPWSLKRLEASGRGSVEAIVRIAVVLGVGADLEALFAARSEVPESMAELEKLYPAARKRGRTLA